MQHKDSKNFRKKLTKTLAAGVLASMCLGWAPSQALAAPVITNMPHRADGMRITGGQPAPKGMPGDVAVKRKTQNAAAANAAADNKPAPVTDNKPATAADNKPATVGGAVTTEGVKPAVQPARTVPRTEPAKPAVPVVQTAPGPAVVQPAVTAGSTKPPSAKLPTRPPGWETKKPAQEKQAPVVRKNPPSKAENQEPVKSVYQVGDKGWKVKQAQQYLQKLGFDPGGTDGNFTKSTRKAIRKFQKKYNRKETGNLDNATYDELKWQVEAREYGGSVASTKILKTAAQYKGVKYVFGGTTPKGFDCSGYVQYVFARHGVRLTRTADTQALEGKHVSRKNLKPGDLVFFTTYEPGASHVGIYAGNNKFWNATSSRGVMLCDLNDSYWGPRYYTARRILTGNDRSR